MATPARMRFIWTHCLLEQSWGSASKEAKTTDAGQTTSIGSHTPGSRGDFIQTTVEREGAGFDIEIPEASDTVLLVFTS